MHIAEQLLTEIAGWGVIAFETAAALLLIAAGVGALLNYLRRRPHTVMIFSKRLNVVLSFKLAAEIMRLTFVRTFTELGMVACIILIHAAISFLINWEIQREEKNRAVDIAYDDREDDINM